LNPYLAASADRPVWRRGEGGHGQGEGEGREVNLCSRMLCRRKKRTEARGEFTGRWVATKVSLGSKKKDGGSIGKTKTHEIEEEKETKRRWTKRLRDPLSSHTGKRGRRDMENRMRRISYSHSE